MSDTVGEFSEHKKPNKKLYPFDYDEYSKICKQHRTSKKISQLVSPLLCDVEETHIVESSIGTVPLSGPLKPDPDAIPSDTFKIEFEEAMRNYYMNF